LFEKINSAADAVRTRTHIRPRFGVILSTGLGDLADAMDVDDAVPYSDIPHFVSSTTVGHKGNFVLGTLGGAPIVAMQGRLHYYEGYTMQDVTFPVRVMRALGVEELIVFNAVGGMNPHLDLGDIVAVTHISLMGDGPLGGTTPPGRSFPACQAVHARAARGAVATELRIPLRRGVRSRRRADLETAAEYRFLRRVGAGHRRHVGGPRDLVAVHAGMRVLGLCVVTDLNPTMRSSPSTSAHHHTARSAERAPPHHHRYLKRASREHTDR
jgi:purine-nucleoside phosphorylase